MPFRQINCVQPACLVRRLFMPLDRGDDERNESSCHASVGLCRQMMTVPLIARLSRVHRAGDLFIGSSNRYRPMRTDGCNNPGDIRIGFRHRHAVLAIVIASVVKNDDCVPGSIALARARTCALVCPLMALTLTFASYPFFRSMLSSRAGHASEVLTPTPFVLLAPRAKI